MKKFNRGFTLIELLVVIAIIGILSSVVLASLNTARSKGANAAVKSNLSNLRSQAEIFYDTAGNQTYTGLCANATVAKATAAAQSASSAASVNTTLATAQVSTTVNCHETAGAYAVASPLKVAEGTSVYWCIDSTGFSAGRINPLAASAVTCPAS